MAYHTASICINGHVITDSVEYNPDSNKGFCRSCGSKSITECPSCEHKIDGAEEAALSQLLPYEGSPAYCHNCGNPFPWTTTAIETAVALSIEDIGESEIDKKGLKSYIEDIVRNTPQAPLSATRFQKLLTKMKGSTKDAIKQTLIAIVSEATKNIIWPGR